MEYRKLFSYHLIARKTKRGMRPHTKLFDEEDPWDFLPASTHKTFLSLHNEEPEELCIVNTTNEILLSTDHEQRLTMRQKAVLNKEESLDLLEPEQLLGLSDTGIFIAFINILTLRRYHKEQNAHGRPTTEKTREKRQKKRAK